MILNLRILIVKFESISILKTYKLKLIEKK